MSATIDIIRRQITMTVSRPTPRTREERASLHRELDAALDALMGDGKEEPRQGPGRLADQDDESA